MFTKLFLIVSLCTIALIESKSIVRREVIEPESTTIELESTAIELESTIAPVDQINTYEIEHNGETVYVLSHDNLTSEQLNQTVHPILNSNEVVQLTVKREHHYGENVGGPRDKDGYHIDEKRDQEQVEREIKLDPYIHVDENRVVRDRQKRRVTDGGPYAAGARYSNDDDDDDDEDDDDDDDESDARMIKTKNANRNISSQRRPEGGAFTVNDNSEKDKPALARITTDNVSSQILNNTMRRLQGGAFTVNENETYNFVRTIKTEGTKNNVFLNIEPVVSSMPVFNYIYKKNGTEIKFSSTQNLTESQVEQQIESLQQQYQDRMELVDKAREVVVNLNQIFGQITSSFWKEFQDQMQNFSIRMNNLQNNFYAMTMRKFNETY